jgi:hypothetical protein
VFSSSNGNLIFIGVSIESHFVSGVNSLFIWIGVDSQVVEVRVIKTTWLVHRISSSVPSSVLRHSSFHSPEWVHVVSRMFSLNESSFLLLILIRFFPCFLTICHLVTIHNLRLYWWIYHVFLRCLSEIIFNFGTVGRQNTVCFGYFLETIGFSIFLWQHYGLYIWVMFFHQLSIGCLYFFIIAPTRYSQYLVVVFWLLAELLYLLCK